MTLKTGDMITFERTFTIDDVKLFSKVSGDEGVHHIHPDDQGRLVLQGLLTATLPTKVGGDHNILARTMNFEFIKPVYTGDHIICEVIIDKYEKLDNRINIITSFTCVNQHEKIVMKGYVSGVIFDSVVR